MFLSLLMASVMQLHFSVEEQDIFLALYTLVNL